MAALHRPEALRLGPVDAIEALVNSRELLLHRLVALEIGRRRAQLASLNIHDVVLVKEALGKDSLALDAVARPGLLNFVVDGVVVGAHVGRTGRLDRRKGRL